MDNNNTPIEELENLEEEFHNDMKYWWVFILLGVLSLGLGIYVLNRPIATYFALSIVFAVAFLVNGISSAAFTLSNKDKIRGWGWPLAFAVLEIILGLILVLNRQLSNEVLAFYIGFSFLFASFNTISLAFTTKGLGDKGWVATLIFGILAAILAILLLMHPLLGAVSVVIWTSIALFTLAISLIVLGYRLYKMSKQV